MYGESIDKSCLQCASFACLPRQSRVFLHIAYSGNLQQQRRMTTNQTRLRQLGLWVFCETLPASQRPPTVFHSRSHGIRSRCNDPDLANTTPAWKVCLHRHDWLWKIGISTDARPVCYVTIRLGLPMDEKRKRHVAPVSAGHKKRARWGKIGLEER